MDTALNVDESPSPLTRNWWAVALRGVAAIVFGVLAIFLPGLTLTALVLLFGTFALVDGIFNLIAAVRGLEGNRPWWALLLGGVAGVAAGLVALGLPGVTALALLYLIAAWAVITGVLEIVTAIRLRQQIRREWLLVLGGVLSIAFGALLFAFPGAGALAVVLWIGAYAIVMGGVLLVLAYRLRTWQAEQRVPMARAA